MPAGVPDVSARSKALGGSDRRAGVGRCRGPVSAGSHQSALQRPRILRLKAHHQLRSIAARVPPERSSASSPCMSSAASSKSKICAFSAMRVRPGRCDGFHSDRWTGRCDRSRHTARRPRRRSCGRAPSRLPRETFDLTYGDLGSHVMKHELNVEGPLRENYLQGFLDTEHHDTWDTDSAGPSSARTRRSIGPEPASCRPPQAFRTRITKEGPPPAPASHLVASQVSPMHHWLVYLMQPPPTTSSCAAAGASRSSRYAPGEPTPTLRSGRPMFWKATAAACGRLQGGVAGRGRLAQLKSCRR